MNAAKLSLCFSALVLRSSRSKLPSASDLTGMTFKPAITADYELSSVSPEVESENEFTYSGVGSVCANRNQADITMTFTSRFMISPNDRQTSILSSSARVWLQGASVETSDLAKVVFEFLLILVK